MPSGELLANLNFWTQNQTAKYLSDLTNRFRSIIFVRDHFLLIDAVQKKEVVEEGYTVPDGSEVVSKKMTRVVTTSQSTVSG